MHLNASDVVLLIEARVRDLERDTHLTSVFERQAGVVTLRIEGAVGSAASSGTDTRIAHILLLRLTVTDELKRCCASFKCGFGTIPAMKNRIVPEPHNQMVPGAGSDEDFRRSAFGSGTSSITSITCG
jgi:hypothetical protein